MSFIFWHRLSKFCLPPSLWPILLCKSIARVIYPSVHAQDFFSTNWSTPYQLSTFQLIRFTLIEALKWHITIKPSQTYFVSKHRKLPTLCRTSAFPWQKVSGKSSCFPPPPFFFFIFFYQKEYNQASFGNRLLSCEHLCLFHNNVRIIVMPGNLNSSVDFSRQQQCLRQVFLGRLRDWVPICWLATQGSRASPLAICLVL